MPLFKTGELFSGTTEQILVLLLLVLPMAGFLLTALVGRRLRTRAWIIAVPIIVVTWLVGMYIVYQALFVGAWANSQGQGMSQLQMSNQLPTSRQAGVVAIGLPP